jgi:hypothetical protein
VPFIFPAPKSAMDTAEQPTLVEEDVYQLTAQITTPTVSTATPESVNRYRVIRLVTWSVAASPRQEDYSSAGSG